MILIFHNNSSRIMMIL